MLREASGRVRPSKPTRSPPRTSRSAAARPSTMARSSFDWFARFEAKAIDADLSIQTQTVWADSHSRSRT